MSEETTTLSLLIENPTCNCFDLRLTSRQLVIPAHATGAKAVTVEVEEDAPGLQRWIKQMRSAHPAIQIAIFTDSDDTGDVIEPDDTGDVIEPDDTGDVIEPGGTGDVAEPGGTGDVTEPPDPENDSLEAFLAKVTSAKKEDTGGWWTVIVDGVEEKVRGAEDEDDAILMAYQKLGVAE